MRKPLIVLAMFVSSSASARTDDAAITLRNETGMVVRLIPFGATVTQIEVPDRDGKRADVLLGFATPAEFRAKRAKASSGPTPGPYAGRIGGAVPIGLGTATA